jgi:hypothetical protein
VKNENSLQLRTGKIFFNMMAQFARHRHANDENFPNVNEMKRRRSAKVAVEFYECMNEHELVHSHILFGC